jgi:hypothetical protein
VANCPISGQGAKERKSNRTTQVNVNKEGEILALQLIIINKYCSLSKSISQVGLGK